MRETAKVAPRFGDSRGPTCEMAQGLSLFEEKQTTNKNVWGQPLPIKQLCVGVRERAPFKERGRAGRAPGRERYLLLRPCGNLQPVRNPRTSSYEAAHRPYGPM